MVNLRFYMVKSVVISDFVPYLERVSSPNCKNVTTSLAVQWLRACVSTAGYTFDDPLQGIRLMTRRKILHACGVAKKKL